MATNEVNILLVEDEAIIALSQKVELENYNYKVTIAHNGKEAIDICIKDKIFHLILMDIDLGKGIDGTVTAQEILTFLDIPILFTSVHTEREIVEKTEKITSYGYVVKNSGIIVIDASIKMALKLFKANKKIKSHVEELIFSKERYETLIENSRDAIFCYEYYPPIDTSASIKDQVKELYRGKISECNQIAAKYYGFDSPKDVIGKQLTEIFKAKPGGPVDELFTSFIQNNYQIKDGQGVEELEDGTNRYYSNNAMGILKSNHLIRVWGIFHDITELKNLYNTR